LAKCTITLEDNPDGSMSVNAAFDPPIERGEDGSPAQQVAAAVIDGITSSAETVEQVEAEYVTEGKN